MNIDQTLQKEEELWQLALRKNSIFHYDKYLTLYPNGKYIEEANAKKNKLLEDQEAAIAKAWQDAVTENTYFAVLRFKNKYPNSKFKSEVDKKLLELESTKQQEVQKIEEQF